MRSGIFGAEPAHQKSDDFLGISGTSKSGGTTYIISTVFSEGSVGATLIGTYPAIDVPNSPWATSNGGAINATFTSGGGATFGPAGGNLAAAMLNTGSADRTITFNGVLFTGTSFDIGVRCNSVLSKGLLLDWAASTGNLVLTDVGTVNTTVASGNIGTTKSGTITFTLSGQSVSVNVFGTILSGTIPVGSPTLALTYIGMSITGAVGNTNTTTMKVTSLTVR